MRIKIQEPYKPLYTTKKLVCLLSGGRGSAKSFNTSTFGERVSFEQGHRILFSRYTMASASDSVIPEFQEKIDLEGTNKFFKVTKNDIINRKSRTEIMFRGIKTSSGNQTAKLKSIKGLSIFIGDEMEEWQNEDDFEKLALSIRQKNVQNRIILSLNPTDAEHFLYKRYIENTHKIIEIDNVRVQISTHSDVEHIHTTYLDNIENLSPQFLRVIMEIRDKSIKEATRPDGTFDKDKFQLTKYATKIIGRWADIPEGAIFTNHREGEFDESLPYCYGEDFGFEIDPDTLIRVAVDKKLKKVYVHEAYYGTKKLGTDDMAKMVKSRLLRPDDLVVADNAEPRLITDMGNAGLNITKSKKGQGSVTAGIKALQDYEIIYTPESLNVRRELRKYRWNDKKAGIPIDDDNHAIDAIRYAFRRLTEGITESVSKEELGFY